MTEPPAGPAPGAAAAAWLNAADALALFAVDPHGLGGLHLRASAGGVRERWLADLQAVLPADEPLRRLPGHIADERLLGGLDLAATLARGQPVAQRGLLAEAHGGVVIAPMAERLGRGTAARLAAVLDSAEIGFERDGLSQRWPARVGVVAMDEGGPDDEPLAPALRDRLALHADLRECGLRDLAPPRCTAAQVREARARLPRVQLPAALVQALCGTALQLGVAGLRASQHALRATRAAAALAGREQASDDDALQAVRLVLAPLATRLPQAAETEEAEAPPESPPEAPPETPPEPPEAASDTPQQPQPETQALEDRLVEAAIASLPAGLLAALQSQQAAREAGRVGQLGATPRGGRPMGTRSGTPRGGARLNLVETLRAAAPWQALRRRAAAERAQHGAGDAAAAAPRAIHVQADDLRISRLQQRAATATLFVLDASGSSALHRLGEAKGAIQLLLADCYVRRDQVGVIAFRGRQAELLLPPTRSLVRAKRCLAALPGGGGTPLALGLEAALRLAALVQRGGATPVVVLLTDGRANVTRSGENGRAQAEADALQMARQFRASGLATLVVDTSPQPALAAQRLAAEMGGSYRALPHAGAAALSSAVAATLQSLPRPRAG